MILNIEESFSTGDEASFNFNSKLKSQKGSWKKKLLAKKRLYSKFQKTLNSNNLNESLNDHSEYSSGTTLIHDENSNHQSSNDSKVPKVSNKNENRTDKLKNLKNYSFKNNVISSIFSPGDSINTIKKDSKIPVLPAVNPFSDSLFSKLSLHPILVNHLSKKLNFTTPTPIQKKFEGTKEFLCKPNR